MKSLILSLAAGAAALTFATSASSAANESAPVVVRSTDVALTPGVFSDAKTGLFQNAQWLWSGRRYCFYDFGWHGPGYYWCGYATRRGYGWGGPLGWHRWGRTYGGPGFHGGPGFQGRPGWTGRGEFHGGRESGHGGREGYHGGGYEGGRGGGGHEDGHHH